MGRRLDGFDIRLEFDPEGNVDKVSYWDQEGCGHERPLSWTETLDDVVQYHLKHYRMGHDMVPPKRCGFVIKADVPPGIKGAVLHCVLEPHPEHVKHRIEIGS